MANQLKIIGQAYKNFGLKHTSKSTATLPHSQRFFKKHCLNSKEASQLSNASLQGGTIIHLLVQESLTKKISVAEAYSSKKITDKINNYEPFSEKDKKKFDMIIKHSIETANNHILNINELPEQIWQDELEYTVWTPPVETYWLCYIDLIGQSMFGDLKNKFGSIRETKKGISYTSVKIPDRPFFSDLLQIALYKKVCPLKPFLSYASHTDRKLFTEENCEDLREENLQKYLKQLMIYEIAWQKKLEYANGDIEKLAWLCPPDFSDIKKGSFWWEGVPRDFIARYLKFYDIKEN
tara:strand:- start:9527 stop:10408 length:882 start_codon:yes stop_codon:yes gene_type:complete